MLAFGAVAIAAGYGGWSPGLLASLISYLGAEWLFVGRGSGLPILHGEGFIALASFGLTSGIILAMAELMRGARRRSHDNAVALGAERERLRVTLSSIGDAVLATDEKGRVTFLNPVAERLTGLAQRRGARSRARGSPSPLQ